MLDEEKTKALLKDFTLRLKTESAEFMTRAYNAGCSFQEASSMHNTVTLEATLAIYFATWIVAHQSKEIPSEAKEKFLATISRVYDAMMKNVQEKIDEGDFILPENVH